MQPPRSPSWKPIALALAVSACAGCGGGARVCGLDAVTRSARLYQGSSHAHVFTELGVDLSARRLTGRVSELADGAPRITPIDEPLSAQSVDRLGGELRATCGRLETVREPSDVAGGSPSVTIVSEGRPDFRIVAEPHDAPVGASVLVIDRARMQAIEAAFPRPAAR